MERKLILASHGKLASGITSSLELICGKQLAIETLDCYLTEDFDLQKEVKNIMNAYRDDEIVAVSYTHLTLPTTERV